MRVTSSGICGSDLHATAAGPSAVVLGHEFGGLLDDGTLVAVQPILPCGQCGHCDQGREQLCSDSRRRIYGASLDGGLADEAFVDERCIVPVPAGVDPQAVGLVEPIAVAVHAINLSCAKAGDTVLVIGGGSIGLLCAAVLRGRGIVVDLAARHPHQQDVATTLGAGRPCSGKYDVVVDAAGTASSWEQAARSIEAGGEIVLVALPWIPLPIDMRLVMKEVSIRPAAFYGHHEGEREFLEAARVLADHPELPDLLVTHRFGLAEADAAFAAAANRSLGAIKVHVLP